NRDRGFSVRRYCRGSASCPNAALPANTPPECPQREARRFRDAPCPIPPTNLRTLRSNLGAAAVKPQIACAIDIDVVAEPALDGRRDEIARYVVEKRRDYMIVEQKLLGFFEQGCAFRGIGFGVRARDKRVVVRVFVGA